MKLGRIVQRIFKRFVCLSLVAAVLAGCATASARIPVPQLQVSSAQIAGLPRVRVWGDEVPKDLALMAELQITQTRAANPGFFKRGARPKVAYLALSGGGGDGAYGAGFLNGWTQAGTRPQFEIVTGVSTGAIIAPFAFLGPAYDNKLTEIYTQYDTEDIVSATPLLTLIGEGAVSTNSKFASLIDRYVDQALLTAIAAEYNKGRRLLISTTNLDVQRPVIWDMGKLAASKHPRALELFRRIILASASIPGVFRPVLLDVTTNGKTYQEMHVDGGTSSQVFFLPTQIKFAKFDKQFGIRPQRSLYVIWNGRLSPDWEAVKDNAFAVSSRSIVTLIKNQGIGDLSRIYLSARRNKIAYRQTSFPSSFTQKAEKPFERAYMRSLYKVGFQAGASGKAWVGSPPGL